MPARPQALNPDPLTAPAAAIPSRRDGEHRTLAECWRSFARRPSPRLLGAALVLTAGLRVGAGAWSWRDAVMAAGVLVVTPPAEWAIHVYLLHAPALRLGARRLDLPTTREHRQHHLAPAVLDGVLIPLYGVAIFLVLIAATVWVLCRPIGLVIGGDHLALVLTGVLTSYAVLGAYEWVHFLIHTPHRPKRGYYRALWRNHRLHHYKNERYWFGVTSTLGDRLAGTRPAHEDVSRSPTARSLFPAR